MKKLFSLLVVFVLMMIASNPFVLGARSYDFDSVYAGIRAKCDVLIDDLTVAGVTYDYPKGDISTPGTIEYDIKAFIKDTMDYIVNYKGAKGAVTEKNIDAIAKPYVKSLLKEKYYHLANLLIEAYPEAEAEALAGRIPARFNTLYTDIKATALNVIKSVEQNEGGGSDSSNGGVPIVTSPTAGPIGTPTANPLSTPNPNNDTGFIDMNTVEWGLQAVSALKKMNIIAGTSEGTFEPLRQIKKEEFAKLVVMAFGVYDDKAECDFKDVPKDKWYYQYVASLTKIGIVNGIGDGMFGTDTFIPRQDMAVIMHRLIIFLNLHGELNPSQQIFIDDTQIAGYAKEAVYAMRLLGIINGYPGNVFEPSASATRVETAQIIYNALKKFNKLTQ